MIRNELEAESELRRLLTDLGGAGVTAELATAIRNSAEALFREFRSSDRVSALYERIQRGSETAALPEPESCRNLREKLSDPISTKSIVGALRHSGFSGRRDMSLREEDCFSIIIHGALQTLRANFEGFDEITPDRLQTRIESLREVLEALPPDIPGPRQVVTNLIHQMELSTARDSFKTLLRTLRQRVEQQEWEAAAERVAAQANLWARDNPSVVEVEEAQKYLSRLAELQRSHTTQLTDADRISELIKERNYEQALNEVNLSESRLRQSGLRNREALNQVFDKLMEGLAETYEWEESAVTDTASESALQKSVSNLQHLNGWLQKVPDQLSNVESLRNKCEALLNQRGLLLNDLLLRKAREKLQTTSVQDVPAYVQLLRSSDRMFLREWAMKVQIVWDALQLVSKVETPADRINLGRLEGAELELGPSPLTDAAQQAGRDYKRRVASEHLRKMGLLVETLEQSAVNLSFTGNPVQLSDAIVSVTKSILQYRQLQDRDLETFTLTKQVFPEECLAYDQRVRNIRQTSLPEAANRWTKLSTLAARCQVDITTARELFASWHDALGIDFPHSEVQARFAERSTELEIQKLEVGGNFEEALRLLEERRNLLSDRSFLEFERRLRRRQAARLFEPGREAEIAAAIRKYGPDPTLLTILITDFRTTGNCQHLASIYECLHQIELEDQQSAQLVKWAFEFQSENLSPLAQELVSTKTGASASLFAKALAIGDQHAAALKVLGAALKTSTGWLTEPREAVKASYEILSARFTAKCNEIEAGLLELQESCYPSGQTGARYEFKNYAVLGQQIDEAFAGAQVFLDQALPPVARWLVYLSAAKRFDVEFESSLLARVQELEQQLIANSQLLNRLSQARRTATLEGWKKLADLYGILQADYTRRIAAVAIVFQLLLKYLENYPLTTTIVQILVDAYHKGGEGLSRQELTKLVNRLTAEFHYDFRPGHDRFQQVARFEGRSYSEFKAELEAMVTEVEAVATYEDRLSRLLVGKEDRLTLRVKGGASDLDKREIAKVLRQPDSEGRSILDLYNNPPSVSISTVAVGRLRELQRRPWYELIRQAASLAAELNNEGSLKS